jgi:preprotein translocase subunit SecF
MMAGGGIAGRLYRGDVSIEFVRRWKTWVVISGTFIVVSVISLFVRGLHFSQEFTGGTSWTFPNNSSTNQGAISRLVNGIIPTGNAVVQSTSTKLGGHNWTVQAGILTSAVQQHVANAVSSTFHITANSVTVNAVGATWGSDITSKAVEALIIFLVVIVIYLSIAFEWRMAVAAFTALIHDILITIGIYALTGFTISPTSVIGLLTILGYSLYDTVVVFDKVRENSAGLLTSQRSTYSDAANLALNQTLVRSINTSLTALIPVASILFIGAGLLGAGTLKDLALVLFVGMLSGTYSSIFIATPVLAWLKESDPAYKDLAVRVSRRAATTARRAAGDTGSTDAAAAASAATGAATSAGRGDSAASGDDADDADDSVDVAADLADDDRDDVTVSAAAGASASRPVTRQQRVTGSPQRRPGARKKRR